MPVDAHAPRRGEAGPVTAAAVADADVAQVRRFNRTVTQRVGALDEGYLARGRPLGASRVLWEAGDAGCDVRGLRERLDLDSGYLSRLLRTLERDGLVTVSPAADRRVRRVDLTAKGRAERRALDELSDDLARSVLTSLDRGRRSRLIAAMGEVERLLTAGIVAVDVEDPTTGEARACLEAYAAELDQRFDAGFDAERSRPVDPAELTEPAGLLLVARLHGEAVGCGALRRHGDGPAEIKRLWVSASVRGLGVGRRLLHELEGHARRGGAPSVRLDTNRTLVEAIALYRSAGYVEVEAFNDEPYAHHWFEKQLGSPARRAP
jgi:DNA-binding MarR family transcriptional regulator/ribosomal protein S18 acetylase RimI-like enzyme